MHKLAKIIGVVGIGIAGISAMALVAAHGQMNTTASSNGPKAEAGALPGKREKPRCMNQITGANHGADDSFYTAAVMWHELTGRWVECHDKLRAYNRQCNRWRACRGPLSRVCQPRAIGW